MSTYPRLQSWLLWRGSEIILPAVSMKFFKSAVFVVLACGLAVTPCVLSAATRHHTDSTPKAHHRTSHKTAKRHSSHHVSSRHRTVRHTTHHARRRSTHRVAQTASQSKVIARDPNPQAESKNVVAEIPPIPMKNGRLYVPPPMRGSHAILVRQNVRNDAEDLTRIQDKSQLVAMKDAGYLVDLPESKELAVDQDLPDVRSCARPWTVTFLKNLAHAHYVRFHRPLKVTSAARTVDFQRRLMRVNGNAAPVKGMIASPHLSGAAVDISKKGLSISEIAWMRAYLLPLREEDKIDVEEEFLQACFHINVYESYVPRHKKSHRSPGTLLATGVR
jgi:hypothetical protein